MRKAGLFALWSIVATICLCWLYVGGCGERRFLNDGNDPDTASGEPKDYIVYAGDNWFRKIYGYHPLTKQIDTMQSNYGFRQGIAVSADGKQLYLSSEESVVVVDSDSLGFITELSCKGRIAVSPNNRYIAIQSDTLRILDTHDYSELFVDSGYIGKGNFSADGNTFYAIHRTDQSSSFCLYKLDLSVSEPVPVHKVFENVNLRAVTPTPDESKVLMLAYHFGYPQIFAVYDVAADSIIHKHGVNSASRYMAVTPDGHTAFHGNAKGFENGPGSGGPSELVVFDISSNQIDRVVQTNTFIDTLRQAIFPVGHMVITPDGRWLTVLSFNTTELLLFDLQTMTPVDYWQPDPRNKSFVKLSVQAIM